MAELLPPVEGRETPSAAPGPTEQQLIQGPETLAITVTEQNTFPLDPEIEEWEIKTKAWLSTLPKRKNVTMNEMEVWIASNQVPLPHQLKSLPVPDIYKRVRSFHKTIRHPNQVMEGNLEEPSPARFQRTDQWKPVYEWLESLDKDEPVKSKEISDWLSENPSVRDKIFERHSRNHLMHYVQKCHMKILRRRGKIQKVQKVSTSPLVSSPKVLSKEVTPPFTITAPSPVLAIPNSVIMSSKSTTQPKVLSNAVTTLPASVPGTRISSSLNNADVALAKKTEAFRKYELLTDLEIHLTSLISRQNN